MLLSQCFSNRLGKSFKYRVQSMGPRMDPCGTPTVRVRTSESWPLTHTHIHTHTHTHTWSSTSEI